MNSYISIKKRWLLIATIAFIFFAQRGTAQEQSQYPEIPVSRTADISTASTIFTEAETGTIGGQHIIGFGQVGYTGPGFVDYEGEGYMEYTFDGVATTYDLTIRYALASGSRPLEVILNGASLGTIRFAATGSWHVLTTTEPFSITPLAGTNTLRLQTRGSSGANVDSHTLTPK